MHAETTLSPTTPENAPQPIATYFNMTLFNVAVNVHVVAMACQPTGPQRCVFFCLVLFAAASSTRTEYHTMFFVRAASAQTAADF